jgi:hypothetical protein
MPIITIRSCAAASSTGQQQRDTGIAASASTRHVAPFELQASAMRFAVAVLVGTAK